MKVFALLTVSAGILGCASAVDSVDVHPPGVRFKIDAPFCVGSRLPLDFSIDQVLVGTETLKNGDTSHVYTTQPGVRRLKAAITGGSSLQDTTVSIANNQTFIDVVGVYCS